MESRSSVNTSRKSSLTKKATGRTRSELSIQKQAFNEYALPTTDPTRALPKSREGSRSTNRDRSSSSKTHSPDSKLQLPKWNASTNPKSKKVELDGTLELNEEISKNVANLRKRKVKRTLQRSKDETETSNRTPKLLAQPTPSPKAAVGKKHFVKRRGEAKEEEKTVMEPKNIDIKPLLNLLNSLLQPEEFKSKRCSKPVSRSASRSVSKTRGSIKSVSKSKVNQSSKIDKKPETHPDSKSEYFVKGKVAFRKAVGAQLNSRKNSKTRETEQTSESIESTTKKKKRPLKTESEEKAGSKEKGKEPKNKPLKKPKMMANISLKVKEIKETIAAKLEREKSKSKEATARSKKEESVDKKDDSLELEPTCLRRSSLIDPSVSELCLPTQRKFKASKPKPVNELERTSPKNLTENEMSKERPTVSEPNMEMTPDQNKGASTPSNTSNSAPINSLEAHYAKFLETQEKNFKAFSKIVEKFEKESSCESKTALECQEMKRRGELSLKLLREAMQKKQLASTGSRMSLTDPPPVQESELAQIPSLKNAHPKLFTTNRQFPLFMNKTQEPHSSPVAAEGKNLIGPKNTAGRSAEASQDNKPAIMQTESSDSRYSNNSGKKVALNSVHGGQRSPPVNGLGMNQPQRSSEANTLKTAPVMPSSEHKSVQLNPAVKMNQQGPKPPMVHLEVPDKPNEIRKALDIVKLEGPSQSSKKFISKPKTTSPDVTVNNNLQVPLISPCSKSPTVTGPNSPGIRFNEKWVEPVPSSTNAATHLILRQFEEKVPVPLKKQPKLVEIGQIAHAMFPPQKPILLPNEVNTVSPPKSPGIRMLSPRTLNQDMMSSSIEKYSQGMRESIGSQILIRDEVVSEFKHDQGRFPVNLNEETPLKESIIQQSPLQMASRNSVEVAEQEKKEQDQPQAEGVTVFESSIITSPTKAQAKTETEEIKLVQNPEPELAESTSPEKDKDKEKTPPHSPIPVESIDFSKLTLEDKSYAIADFILENLILETFTNTSKVRERLSKASRKIMKYKQSKVGYDVSKYISLVFAHINESPEDQLDIFSKLNTPIVQTDLQRLILASPTVAVHELESVVGVPYESVLNIQLYIKIEEELRDTEYIERQLSVSDIEREHIFHKLLFDALNEKLDYCRIGGLKGHPPKFFSSYKEPKKITPDQCAQILEQSKNELMEWTLEKNGLLYENAKNEELEALDNIREEALLKHLASYAISVEDKWEDLNDETLEVTANLSERILEVLLEDAIQSYEALRKKR